MKLTTAQLKNILNTLDKLSMYHESDFIHNKLTIEQNYSSVEEYINKLIEAAREKQNFRVANKIELAMVKEAQSINIIRSIIKEFNPNARGYRDLTPEQLYAVKSRIKNLLYESPRGPGGRFKSQSPATQPQQVKQLGQGEVDTSNLKIENEILEQPTAVQKFFQISQPKKDLTGTKQSVIKQPSEQAQKPSITDTGTQYEFDDAIKQNNLQDVRTRVEEQVEKGIPRNRAIMMLGLPLGAIALYNLLVKQYYPQKPETETIPTQEQKPATTPQQTTQTTQSTLNLSDVDLKNIPVPDIDALPKVEIFNPGDVSRFERNIPIGY